MFALLNAYFTYAKDPAGAVYGLAENRRFAAAFWGYGAAALCWVVFFWLGQGLSAWGLIWRLAFFWLLEVTLGYLWSALSGLFLNFLSGGNGSPALFIALGLSGFVQGILLCFALAAAVWPWLKPLAAPVFVGTLLLRFVFAVINTARAARVSPGKALGVLCFAWVPAAACMFLCAGLAGLLVSLLF